MLFRKIISKFLEYFNKISIMDSDLSKDAPATLLNGNGNFI